MVLWDFGFNFVVVTVYCLFHNHELKSVIQLALEEDKKKYWLKELRGEHKDYKVFLKRGFRECSPELQKEWCGT